MSDWGSVLGGVGLAAKGQCSGGWGLRTRTIGVAGQVDVRGGEHSVTARHELGSKVDGQYFGKQEGIMVSGG